MRLARKALAKVWNTRSTKADRRESDEQEVPPQPIVYAPVPQAAQRSVARPACSIVFPSPTTNPKFDVSPPWAPGLAGCDGLVILENQDRLSSGSNTSTAISAQYPGGFNPNRRVSGQAHSLAPNPAGNMEYGTPLVLPSANATCESIFWRRPACAVPGARRHSTSESIHSGSGDAGSGPVAVELRTVEYVISDMLPPDLTAVVEDDEDVLIQYRYTRCTPELPSPPAAFLVSDPALVVGIDMNVMCVPQNTTSARCCCPVAGLLRHRCDISYSSVAGVKCNSSPRPTSDNVWK